MHSTLCYNLQIQNSRSEVANGLYARARKRGQQAHLWAGLAGRSRGLLALAEVRAACSVEAQNDGGVRTIAIDRIRGSENRCTDFDSDFHPLRDHSKDRWLSIAEARERGKALPPVALIQVGDLYFVRDGHHRISVARALGQKAIEATVVVWQVSGPLPWDVPAQATDPGFRGLINRLRSRWGQLQKAALLRLRDLSGAVGAALRRPVLPQPGIDTL